MTGVSGGAAKWRPQLSSQMEAARTISPVHIQLNDPVDGGNICIPPPLGLPDEVWIAPLACITGKGVRCK